MTTEIIILDNVHAKSGEFADWLCAKKPAVLLGGYGTVFTASMKKRPSWESITRGRGIIVCECGDILHSLGSARKHWEAGHFDQIEANR